LNLLNNAYDAIQEAGGSGTIWVRTGIGDGKVTLEFLDNGTGIREPERVFDPFYTTKAVGQGTGLGLSVCYGIIEEHNGEIRAGNWERGARFVVTLPVGDTSQQDRVTLPPMGFGARQRGQALVIDDEQSLVELQISFLSAMGLDGIGLRSGEEAVSFLQKNPVDIIISDIRMPGAVDGVELYHWVRQNRPELTKRFLFVSGDLVGMNTGQFFTESTAPRIQKPFKFESYSRIVRQILDHESS
jgi:two-component system NtrC family sensor kinase